MGAEPDDIQGKIYPSFGRCIYCGSDGGRDGLRDEHIIPFSLGGNTVIKKASCRKCEAKTSYIDGYLANAIYGRYRVQAKVQTRRPKARPTAFETMVNIDGAVGVLKIPVEDHPTILQLPNLWLAGLLRGVQPAFGFTAPAMYVYHDVPTDIRERLSLAPEADVAFGLDTRLNLIPFARAMAKIGYCHAVAVRGLDAVRPLAVPALILGDYPCVSHYVGGDGRANQPPPDPKGQRHKVQIMDTSAGRLRLITVAVRLFADSGTPEHGMPIYHVVVGAPRA